MFPLGRSSQIINLAQGLFKHRIKFNVQTGIKLRVGSNIEIKLRVGSNIEIKLRVWSNIEIKLRVGSNIGI